MTQTQLLRRTGLYCRLSKDDDNQGESESIITQKAMLSQYAAEHGFLVTETYIDDGYSGLNFERPNFQRLLSDIEDGKIDIVITKDLSRLGRDHLKVGFYTEIFFPSKRVRYIAVNDAVDTQNNNNDMAALKSVMNEFYSRDTSRKIRSSIKARAKEGLYRSSFSPLGYKKSPDNKNKLVVDAETAPIVRTIFELAAQGWGAHRIRTHFEKNEVPTPSWFLHVRDEKNYSKRFENSAQASYEMTPPESSDAELRNTYEDILTKLTPDERELHTDYFVENKSYVELAKKHNTSEVTVRKRVSRLKQKLDKIVRNVLFD